MISRAKMAKMTREWNLARDVMIATKMICKQTTFRTAERAKTRRETVTGDEENTRKGYDAIGRMRSDNA